MTYHCPHCGQRIPSQSGPPPGVAAVGLRRLETTGSGPVAAVDRTIPTAMPNVGDVGNCVLTAVALGAIGYVIVAYFGRVLGSLQAQPAALVVGGCLALAGFLLMFYVQAVARIGREYVEYLPPERGGEPAARTIPLSNDGRAAGVVFPATRRQMVAFGRGVTGWQADGTFNERLEMSLAERHWKGRGQPFSDGGYRGFIDVLATEGLVETHGDRIAPTLTPVGKVEVKKWARGDVEDFLELHGPPLPRSDNGSA